MPINIQQTQQFGNLELIAKQVVEGFITGLHKSPFHGFSVEFAEHRLYNTGEIPSYPVIKGSTWSPRIVRALVRAAEDMGHEGIIFQGTDSLVDLPSSKQ